MTYNRNTTIYYRSANQLLTSGMKIIDKEQARLSHLHIKNTDDSMSIESLDVYLLPFPKAFSFEVQTLENRILHLTDSHRFRSHVNGHRKRIHSLEDIDSNNNNNLMEVD